MQISGITLDGVILTPLKKENATTFFKTFIEYCIDNYSVQIRNSKTLQKYIKLSGEYPDFNRAIAYKRVISYNGLFYTDWRGTKSKISRINAISEELGINLILTVKD